MYDNIKSAIVAGADKEAFNFYLRELRNNVNIKKTMSGDRQEVYMGRIYKELDAVDALDKSKTKGVPYIQLRILYLPKEDIMEIKIRNSIRKFYFGADSMQDLSKTDLEDVLDILADKLWISKECIKDFINYKIEIGVTNEHERNFNMFMLSVIDHKYLKDQLRVNSDTVSHMGDNLTVSCYNKGEEVKNNQKLKKKLNLPEDVYYLRSEIKIHKVSGVKFALDNLRTIGDLLNNHERAYDFMIRQLQYIKFIDCISPRVAEHVLLSQKLNKDNKNKNSEFHDLIRFLGVEYIGWPKLREMCKIFTNKSSSTINKYGAIETKFRQLQNPTYRRIYFDKLKKKKNEIMK